MVELEVSGDDLSGAQVRLEGQGAVSGLEVVDDLPVGFGEQLACGGPEVVHLIFVGHCCTDQAESSAIGKLEAKVLPVSVLLDEHASAASFIRALRVLGALDEHGVA